MDTQQNPCTKAQDDERAKKLRAMGAKIGDFRADEDRCRICGYARFLGFTCAWCGAEQLPKLS